MFFYSSMSSRGEAVAIQMRFQVYLDCEATALRTLLHRYSKWRSEAEFSSPDRGRCRFATEGVDNESFSVVFLVVIFLSFFPWSWGVLSQQSVFVSEDMLFLFLHSLIQIWFVESESQVFASSLVKLVHHFAD